MKAMLERLGEQTARVERVIFLAGALAAGDAVADDLDQFLDYEDQGTIEKCLGKVPKWVNLDARSHERAEDISEWLIDGEKLGFLVKFATPVMELIGVDARSFSWGVYGTTWIYAETLDEAIAKGLDWVDQRRAAEDAKAQKGGAA